MGLSLPPPASFDLVGSYARRRGSDVEIVLSKPEIELGADAPRLTLTKGETDVQATGERVDAAIGARLSLRAPAAQLRDGVWTLSLRNVKGEDERLAARLLVQGERPIVLLWGAKAQNTIVPSKRAVSDPRKRAAAKAGHALDKALSVLPDDQAKKIRAQVRRTARKILT